MGTITSSSTKPKKGEIFSTSFFYYAMYILEFSDSSDMSDLGFPLSPCPSSKWSIGKSPWASVFISKAPRFDYSYLTSSIFISTSGNSNGRIWWVFLEFTAPSANWQGSGVKQLMAGGLFEFSRAMCCFTGIVFYARILFCLLNFSTFIFELKGIGSSCEQISPTLPKRGDLEFGAGCATFPERDPSFMDSGDK